jgi:hypothetical protein
MGLAAMFGSRVAHADDRPNPYGYEWHETGMTSEIGVSTILGGGISGFTDSAMRDVMSSSVQGLWDLRVTLGSHTPVAVDIGYVGTAGTINGQFNNVSQTLLGTTLEAALRYNILPHYAWNPYLFVGVGWQRYNVSGSDLSLADNGMRSSDDSVVYPMGGGIVWRDTSGLVADLHGTFRGNQDYGLVKDSLHNGDFIPMHTWEASAAIGYEF